MPGNLEAPPILSNARTDVKGKTLIPQGFLPNRHGIAGRHKAGVKGAEGGAANP
jgi:hypothetical protein